MTRIGLLLPMIALLGACSETADGPTAAGVPGDAAALAQIGTRSAPAPLVTCSVHPNGIQYDATVTWSRVPTSTIVLLNNTFSTGNPSASYQIDLKHTRRKGTVSATVDFRPLLVLMGDDGVGTGQESCVLISS
jgi:hypothetical protein